MKKTVFTLVAGLSFTQCCYASCPLSPEKSFENSQRIELSLSDSIACLASENPKVRDEIAYTGLSEKLRSGALTVAQIKEVFQELITEIEKSANTAYHHAFLILTVAEIARVDRLTPILTESERGRLVTIATRSLVEVNDYTGFDEKIGYVHQVAHAADLTLQLALNNAIDTASIKRLSVAVRKAINPTVTHFYHYGEPDRLVRATVYLMLRESVPIEYWEQWLINAAQSPLHSWQKAYSTNQGLAALHNTQSFFNRLLLWTAEAKSPRLKMINQKALEHLKAIR